MPATSSRASSQTLVDLPNYVDTDSDGDFNSIYGSDVESTFDEEDEGELATLIDHDHVSSHISSPGLFNSIYGSDVESQSFEHDEGGPPNLAAFSTPGASSSRRVPQGPGIPATQQGPPLCVVCNKNPRLSKGGKQFTTCGLTCAALLKFDGRSKSMCVVCGVQPSYSKGGKKYPTCGLTCARNLQSGGGALQSGHSNAFHSGVALQSGRGAVPMCVVCGVQPRYSQEGKQYSTCGMACAERFKHKGGSSSMCVVCGANPRYSNGGKQYPTCGLTCAGQLQSKSMCIVCGVQPKYSHRGKKYPTCGLSCARRLKPTSSSKSMCVVCGVRPRHSNGPKVYPTCGLTCANKYNLLCDYCHRKPKVNNYLHCGKTCRDKARMACLMCHSRPKNGKYHFCGRTCRDAAMNIAPLLLEVQPGHVTYSMVENKFKKAWNHPQNGPCPTIRKVYKIVESSSFLAPYDSYRNKHGNESFRYHGTNRQCKLGEPGNLRLCGSGSCPACSILNTSFKVSLALSSGGFGQGVYTSSAPNKAANYTSTNLIFLTKVVLGKARNVTQFNEVMSCPPGYHSVVFDRCNGQLNETVVYTNDAIRPVFLILFS